MANSDNGLVLASLAQSTKIGKALPNVVADWLEENVDPETGYVLDSTLTIANAAADAKAVGDRIESAGLTDAIKQALLQLASKVAYIDDDGQDYYDDLYAALYNTTWAITNTLTNCTTSNGISSIHKGDAYSATITASSGYTLTGATVSITMGGTDITSTAYNNGTISIASVTGDLIIAVTASASEKLWIEQLGSSGSIANFLYAPFILPTDTYSYDYTKKITAIEADFTASGNISVGYCSFGHPSGTYDSSIVTIVETLAVGSTGVSKLNLSDPMTIPAGYALVIGADTDSAKFKYGGSLTSGFVYNGTNGWTDQSKKLGINVYRR